VLVADVLFDAVEEVKVVVALVAVAVVDALVEVLFVVEEMEVDPLVEVE